MTKTKILSLAALLTTSFFALPSTTFALTTINTSNNSVSIHTSTNTNTSTHISVGGTGSHITISHSNGETTTSNNSNTPTATPTNVITSPPLIRRRKITPTPTEKITPTKIATPTPTKRVTPTPIKKLTPTPTKAFSSGLLDDRQTYMLNAINAYRATYNLAPVKPDTYTCNFAKVRAKEITTDFSHTGWENRVNSHTLPYPSYSYITENIAETSNYKDVVNLWINSPGHAENMRANTPYVCIAYNSNYYAYEGWKP